MLRSCPLVAVVLLAACGVRFRSEFEGTELLKGISLTGERRAGAELTVNLQVSRVYPVPVRVACFYEASGRLSKEQKKLAFEERGTAIGEVVLDPAAERRPDEKAPEERLTFRFSAPAPGKYSLACLTPAAGENAWGMTFRIGE